MKKAPRTILIIGGAGFIGINSAAFFLEKKWGVTIFDNFSRKGVEKNVDWLSKKKMPGLRIVKGDIRKDLLLLEKETEKHAVILNLAAQVAVTTSVIDPRLDFEINCLGTFNVLEAIRNSKNKPILLYSSTNKVYGGLEHLKIKTTETRHDFKDKPLGVDETEPLDFHSPYGCSKGSADQYVRDYSRIYGLKTVVLRQSCIYGPHQFGIEDQGWVAWFGIATILGRPITIYGDGKQMRDILYVDDLVRLYYSVIKNIKVASGKVYNVGGGPLNKLSLLELLAYLEKRLGKKIVTSSTNTRPGDQPVFVADIRKATRELGWEPKYRTDNGINKMLEWINKNKETVESIIKFK